MSVNMGKIITLSIPTLKGFRRLEPRTWGRCGTILELVTEIGALGRIVTIQEKYRFGKKTIHDIGDELSDVLFVIIRVLEDTGAKLEKNIVESARINCPEETIFEMLSEALKIKDEWAEKSPDCNLISHSAERIIADLSGLADRYNIELETAHRHEMDFAQLWQKIFFFKGEKAKTLIWFRKIIWGFAGLWHLHKMNKTAGVKK
jgi:hypothetical protein